jgi:hypothetical protein
MRRVLSEDAAYSYLSPRAQTRLEEARSLARRWKLTGDPFIPLENPETPAEAAAPAETNGPATANGATAAEDKAADGKDSPQSGTGPFSFILLPWLGSRTLRTLQLILQRREYRKTLGLRSLSREDDYAFYITSTLPVPAFREALKTIAGNIQNLEALIDPAEIPLSGKFDDLLPPRLLVKQYAANMLDSPGQIVRALG